MDQVVPVAPDHPEAFNEHEQITHHLLHRKTRTDISDAQGSCNPVDAAVGDVYILAFVEGEQVDLVPPGAQEFEHPPDGQGSSAGLKEWVRCEHQDVHPTGSSTRADMPLSWRTASTSSCCRMVFHPNSAPANWATSETVARSSRPAAPRPVRRNTISASFNAISSCTACRTTAGL